MILMTCTKRLIFLFLFLMTTSSLLSQDTCDSSECYTDCSSEDICFEQPFLLPHKFYVGPEIYHLRRTREGGTRQTGEIYGVRVGYDRIKCSGLYWGGDALYGTGTLRGRSGIGDRLKSAFTDEQIEGRIGFTLQTKKWLRPFLTPFVGYGYFQETNKFRHPSPLRLKFRTCYNYFLTGFLSGLDINPHLSVGVNLKVRIMHDAKCKVSNDPELDNATLHINDKINYRIEIPIAYRLCSFTDHFELDLVPFYEFRHYGGRENFPFSFFDTKLRLYGINIQFSVRF